KPLRTKLAKRVNSLKRERQWRSVLHQMDELSTKDINDITKRVQLENSLKKLSKSSIGTKKDKEDYLRRERLDNDQLTQIVTRLRAKEALAHAVNDASKEQREFGQKIVQIGGSLGVKYALTKSVGVNDVISAVKNPKEASKKAQGDLLKAVTEKLKEQNGKRK